MRQALRRSIANSTKGTITGIPVASALRTPFRIWIKSQCHNQNEKPKEVITNVGLATVLLLAACGCHDATGFAKRAAEREKNGNLSGALADFDEAIMLQPNLTDAYIGRGDVEMKSRNYLSAAVDYNRAAKLKPELVHQHDFSQFARANPVNLIAEQALGLLEVKDYDKLDALAAKLRASKERFADGMWQLAIFYDGLVPLNSEPEVVWDDRIQAIGLWATSRPESITARVAWGYVLVNYAWKARGGGEVNTVYHLMAGVSFSPTAQPGGDDFETSQISKRKVPGILERHDASRPGIAG